MQASTCCIRKLLSRIVALFSELDLLYLWKTRLFAATDVKNWIFRFFALDGHKVITMLIFYFHLLVHYFLHADVGFVGNIVGFLKLSQDLITKVFLQLLLLQAFSLSAS